MSFAKVRDGLVSTLEGVETYPGMVAYADYSILNAGVEKAIIIRFQRMRTQRAAFQGEMWRDWVFRLEAYNMVGDDIEQARGRQDEDRDAIADALDANPELGGVAEVFDSQLNEAFPEEITRTAGNFNFVCERFLVTVREEVS